MRVAKDTPLGFSVPVLPFGGELLYEPAILRAGTQVVGSISPDGRETVVWGVIKISAQGHTGKRGDSMINSDQVRLL